MNMLETLASYEYHTGYYIGMAADLVQQCPEDTRPWLSLEDQRTRLRAIFTRY